MIYSWLYVLMNALSGLLRQIAGNMVAPAAIMLVGAIISIMFFNFINASKLKSIYRACWQHKISWITMGLTVTGLWLPAFYAPSIIGASLYTFIFFAMMGILGKSALYRKDQHKKIISLLSLIGLGTLLSAVILVSLYLNFSWQEIEGISISLFGSYMGFLYSRQSAQFAKKAVMTASGILAVRFYLAIPISFALLPMHSEIALGTHPFLITAIGVFCLILPAYLSQKGIEKAGADTNAMIISVTPFFTGILQYLYFKNIAWQYFVIYSLYVVIIAMPMCVKLFNNRKIFIAKKQYEHG